MYSSLSKKLGIALFAIVGVMLIVGINACQKELSGTTNPTVETPPDLATKVNAGISGFVTNESNQPAEGALVQFGTANTITDKYGYFSIASTQVTKNAAVLSVVQPGYFKAIKTYIASEGRKGFFRIKLLPKTNEGNFNGATGGSITPANGIKIDFPANAVMVASTNVPYPGTVNVAVQWLNPTDYNELIKTMPGDLRGLDSLGFMRTLTSFGMCAVELTSTSGELLQIATGKKATLSMPIPTAMNAAAPNSIPLWHFNETNGLWVQEGNALKTGSDYVGEVSHFSYWNCDLPNATVPLTFTVVDSAGHPLSGAHVEITPTTSNSWSHIGGFTDSSGYVNVLVTPNASYTLSIFGECGTWNNPAYTQNFSVGTTAVNLGVITIGGPSVATVSGTVECSGAPLSNAYVVMSKGYYNYRYPVNADGTYSFTTTLCGGATVVTLVAENLSTLQSGNPVTQTLTTGNNTVAPLSACVNNINQYINYTVNGTNVSLSYPIDSIYHYVNTQATPVTSMINGYGAGTGGTNVGYVNFDFNQTGIAVGSTQLLNSFMCSQIPDSLTTINPAITVNITEYGLVGEFIAGNFSGTITSGPPASTAYNITCSFRARRRQ